MFTAREKKFTQSNIIFLEITVTGKSANMTKFKVNQALKHNFIYEHLCLSYITWWLFNGVYINGEASLMVGTFVSIHVTHAMFICPKQSDNFTVL